MGLDSSILNFVVSHRNPVLNQVMIAITQIGKGEIVVFGLIMSIIIFILLKRFYSALMLLISVSVGEIFVYLTKRIIERPRPPSIYALVSESSFSFPSGHSFVAVSFYGLLFYFLYTSTKNKYLKLIILIFGIGLILSIGISRIYLGVHWFSDVLLSFILASIWVRSLIFIFKSAKIKHGPKH